MVFAVCPDSLCFQILVQIHACDLELGERKEKGGEGKIPSLCQSLVYYDDFWGKNLVASELPVLPP